MNTPTFNSGVSFLSCCFFIQGEIKNKGGIINLEVFYRIEAKKSTYQVCSHNGGTEFIFSREGQTYHVGKTYKTPEQALYNLKKHLGKDFPKDSKLQYGVQIGKKDERKENLNKLFDGIDYLWTATGVICIGWLIIYILMVTMERVGVDSSLGYMVSMIVIVLYVFLIIKVKEDGRNHKQ